MPVPILAPPPGYEDADVVRATDEHYTSAIVSGRAFSPIDIAAFRRHVETSGRGAVVPFSLSGFEDPVAQMMAQAAPQILNQSKQMAAQQQAQKNAQDPVLQAQLQDEVNQKAEIDRKSKRDAEDVRIAGEKLALERQKLEAEGKGPGAA